MTWQGLMIGVFAWLATAGIVTAWQLATRWGVTTTLTPLDLALLRYGVPGLALAPIFWRLGAYAKGQSVWTTVLLVLGGGLPFGLLGMAGAQFAPAAHMGALLPGSMPLFVALLSALVLGERFSGIRRLGLTLIVGAVFCITGGTLVEGIGAHVIFGDALFLIAGVSWAVYTVIFRQSRLDVWHAAAIISGWSTLAVVPLWLLSPSSGLLAAPFHDVMLQILVQGFLAGLFGMAIFGLAVRRLGPSAAALSGSVVPALTALGGWALLGERITTFTALGIVVMVAGLTAFAIGGNRG
ncbi:MAG: DMT family transporter [Pseudomonadota bacterium]